MNSYERIGDSNYYFDGDSGMFWGGYAQKWLDRAEYEVSTANAWR